MLELLSNYEGKLKINNVEYENIKEAQKAFKDYKGGLTIILNEDQDIYMKSRDFSLLN